jgi:thiamine monophosphate kinase
VDCLHLAVTGGEDFELLFTVRPSAVGAAHRALARVEGRAIPIGAITSADAGIVAIGRDGGTTPLGQAFQHF